LIKWKRRRGFVQNDYTVICKSDLENLQDASTACLDKLMKYYEIHSDAYIVAILLDPRFKMSFFDSDEDEDHEVRAEKKAYALNKLKEEFSYYAPTCIPEQPTVEPSSCSFLPKRRRKELRDEIAIFLAEEELDSDADVFKYWKVNQSRFPTLARIARDYFAIQGTSAASERAFSGGRQTITPFRCSLNAESIRATQCLKSWMKIV